MTNMVSGPVAAPAASQGGGGRRRPPTAVGTLPEPPPLAVIWVDLPDKRLCGNGDAHGPLRTRLVREQRLAALDAGRAVLLAHHLRISDTIFPLHGAVVIDVEVHRDPLWSARRLDPPNLTHGLKAAVDGLTEAGIFYKSDALVRWGRVAWVKAQPYRGGVKLTLRAE